MMSCPNQAVMARLEAEHAVGREQLKEEARRREEAAAAQAGAALREARKAEAKMAERFRAAGQAAQVRAPRRARQLLRVGTGHGVAAALPVANACEP